MPRSICTSENMELKNWLTFTRVDSLCEAWILSTESLSLPTKWNYRVIQIPPRPTINVVEIKMTFFVVFIAGHILMASSQQIGKNSYLIAVLFLYHFANIYRCINLNGKQSKFNANFACWAALTGRATMPRDSMHIRSQWNTSFNRYIRKSVRWFLRFFV